MGIPSLELPDGGVPWYSCPIQLQLRVPRQIQREHLGHVLILLTLGQRSPSLAFGRLGHLWRNPLIVRDQLPLLDHFLVHFPLLQIGRREKVS